MYIIIIKVYNVSGMQKYVYVYMCACVDIYTCATGIYYMCVICVCVSMFVYAYV